MPRALPGRGCGPGHPDQDVGPAAVGRARDGGALIIQRIGVVVPAQNEQQLLPACLAAIGRAAASVPVAVSVIVVADSCTDATARVARDVPGVQVLEVEHRRVGMVRAAGMAALIEQLGVEGTWLATTDADSVVPESWLERQMARARAGADAIAGTVRVMDWTGHSRRVQVGYLRRYRAAEGHDHVHGANLSMSARAYLTVGGFPPLAVHEDLALVTALAQRGLRVDRSGDLGVATSARAVGRVSAGFAGYLRQLACETAAAPG